VCAERPSSIELARGNEARHAARRRFGHESQAAEFQAAVVSTLKALAHTLRGELARDPSVRLMREALLDVYDGVAARVHDVLQV
jgi:hypothetical protein